MGAIEDKARQLLDVRMGVVRSLVEAHQAVADADAALASAAAAERDAYRQAVRAGWSVVELRELGFSEPSSEGRRPRRGRAGGGKRSVSKPVSERSDTEELGGAVVSEVPAE